MCSLPSLPVDHDAQQQQAQAVRKKLPPPPEPLSQNAAEAAAGHEYVAPEDYVARDEVFKVRHLLARGSR